jgi:hypothetical protein
VLCPRRRREPALRWSQAQSVAAAAEVAAAQRARVEAQERGAEEERRALVRALAPSTLHAAMAWREPLRGARASLPVGVLGPPVMPALPCPQAAREEAEALVAAATAARQSQARVAAELETQRAELAALQREAEARREEDARSRVALQELQVAAAGSGSDMCNGYSLAPERLSATEAWMLLFACLHYVGQRGVHQGLCTSVTLALLSITMCRRHCARPSRGASARSTSTAAPRRRGRRRSTPWARRKLRWRRRIGGLRRCAGARAACDGVCVCDGV